jgi:hypothetical protein
MRINSRKVRKILGRIWSTSKCIFETFLHSKSTKMQRHECNTHNFLFWFRKSKKDFSYTIFPVKKNKCWKNFKIMRKLLFNYSLYSHPEIGNFRVWQYSFPLCISRIWHGICNMMYRHPCVLDCMHFVSFALVRKRFSYIHCSPWNGSYVFVSLFGMIWLVWLSSW